MDEIQRKRLAAGLRAMPGSDEDVLLWQGEELTLRQMADAIEQQTQVGLSLCESFEESACDGETLENAVSQFFELTASDP